jgi:homospermidine synthase
MKVTFDKDLLIVGFGCIGCAVLPLLLKHLDISPARVKIVDKSDAHRKIADDYGVSFIQQKITEENFAQVIEPLLTEGDFLLNLSVDISSFELIQLCQQHKVLYLDTVTEPWAGVYANPNIDLSARTNYVLREEVLALKKTATTTALITHGANPGLVSHFVKQALINLAQDNQYPLQEVKTQQEWSDLSQKLSIKAIHIAEHDTQHADKKRERGEFINTWSVEGFMGESCQPAELSWGTHERHWPQDACSHQAGSRVGIYMQKAGGDTRVRTWTPTSGATYGFLVTHAESLSIGSYLSDFDGGKLSYRPTVHYAYIPCTDAMLSLHEFSSQGCQFLQQQRILMDEIIGGQDMLGVLLMGNPKGAYWFGSTLSIHEARKLAPHNNATSLQVAAGVMAGVLWCIAHPKQGLVEPEEIDFQWILDVAKPYLGELKGIYTDWTPLKNRGILYEESLDKNCPWQFLNIRAT